MCREEIVTNTDTSLIPSPTIVQQLRGKDRFAS
jgi:hypothetical protein